MTRKSASRFTYPFLAAALLIGCAPLAQAAEVPPPHVTVDAAHHFRSGLWDQTLYWSIPGPAAFAAIGRIVDEANTVRLRAGLTTLKTSPKSPLIVGFFEEQNARASDGEPLKDERPNAEIFFATLVRVDVDEIAVFFLTDPMRSSDELTAAGVPGVTAAFERTVTRSTGRDRVRRSLVEATASTPAGDRVTFAARFGDNAAAFHDHGPAAEPYLAGAPDQGFDIIYRALPTRRFRFLEHYASTYYALPDVRIDVKLEVHHHDADVETAFNDPANRPARLIEIRRDVRIEGR